MNFPRIDPLGQRSRTVRLIEDPRSQLAELDSVQQAGQRIQHLGEIGRKFGNALDLPEQFDRVRRDHGFQQDADSRPLHGTQHRMDVGRLEFAATVGNRLVEQGQAVTQGTIGGAGQHLDGFAVEIHLFGGKNVAHLPADLLRGQTLEIELDTARKDGHGQLLRVRRGQQELDVRRRFFERLQQGVERRLGKHVHFVDQIDLVPATRGHVLGVVDELAHVVDAGIAGCVDLQQIDKAACVDVRANAANPAGRRSRALLAIERLGENAGDRGLADAAGSGEQEGMMDTTAVQRMRQRANHVFLADQFGKLARAPFASEYLIGHRGFRKTNLDCANLSRG